MTWRIFAPMDSQGRRLMALTRRSKTRQAPRGDAELERLLDEGRQFSAEFPVLLANHLPMILVALHRLGASDARLREYFATYRDRNYLPPAPPPIAPIDRANWSAALGNRARE